jgi:hypothetical protein
LKVTLVRTPSTFARNKGRTLRTISLETSMKKLAKPATHSLRGRLRTRGVRISVVARSG